MSWQIGVWKTSSAWEQEPPHPEPDRYVYDPSLFWTWLATILNPQSSPSKFWVGVPVWVPLRGGYVLLGLTLTEQPYVPVPTIPLQKSLPFPESGFLRAQCCFSWGVLAVLTCLCRNRNPGYPEMRFHRP